MDEFLLPPSDGTAEEILHDLHVLQAGIAQSGQQMMGISLHLLRGEVQVQQVLPFCAGEAFAEDGHKLLAFLLCQCAYGLGKLGNDMSVCSQIAAPKNRGITLVGVQAALDFRKIFSIHFSHLVDEKHSTASVPHFRPFCQCSLVINRGICYT